MPNLNHRFFSAWPGIRGENEQCKNGLYRMLIDGNRHPSIRCDQVRVAKCIGDNVHQHGYQFRKRIRLAAQLHNQWNQHPVIRNCSVFCHDRVGRCSWFAGGDDFNQAGRELLGTCFVPRGWHVGPGKWNKSGFCIGVL